MNLRQINPDLLNFHHLRYFWVVAREGTISRACERLHVSQPTISGQLKAFEEALGAPLFSKSGRNLTLTSLGEGIASYADDIFSTSRRLTEFINGGGDERQRMTIGVCDQVPKMIAYKIIEPALSISGGLHLSCLEDESRRLFAGLAIHNLDAVLSDQPLPPNMGIQGFNHLLGETGMSFFAAPVLKPKLLKKNFPQSLHGQPFLLPHPDVPVRQQIDGWFQEHQISPLIIGEFQDSALQKVFGKSGKGVFIAPSVIADDVCKQFDVEEIGRSESIRERYYVISNERRLANVATVAITKRAKRLFQA